MAGSSLLALIDDIATLLDDVAILSKVAAKKTAAVLGDDLALNAQQVAGIKADRELPVVWAVAKGSLVNKMILVPAALVISALIPWAIIPLLMMGGCFLCFEGFEKIAHKYLHNPSAEHKAQLVAVANPKIDIVAFEKKKIRGAIRTDFILSAEIIVITLGVVANAGFVKQVIVLSAIAVLITAGVYGLVGGIVKIDDLGLYLYNKEGASGFSKMAGKLLLRMAPVLMKVLSVVGTAAMFLVGGGILTHGIPALHDWILHWLPTLPGVLQVVLPAIINAGVGLLVGAVLTTVISLGRLWK
jgi:uncharacterized protein